MAIYVKDADGVWTYEAVHVSGSERHNSKLHHFELLLRARAV